MTTNSAELKPLPCPFCGYFSRVQSRNAKSAASGKHFFVRCPSCHTEGPRSTLSEAEAIERWNERQAGRTAAQGDQSKYPNPQYDEACHYSCTEAGSIQPKCQAGSAEQVSERPQFVAKPLEDYSPEDQAFYRFWYGHMKNEQMTGALANVDHSTARYIWDAALTTQVEQATERMAFETWIKSVGGSVDLVGDGEYRSAPTECAWTAWLARAALSAPERKVTDASWQMRETISRAADTLDDLGAPHNAKELRALLNQQGEQTAPEGWKLVPDYKVGMLVKFGGEEYKIFAYGDKHGTFDICHPTDNHRDRWVNVPPEMLEPIAAAPSTAQQDGGME